MMTATLIFHPYRVLGRLIVEFVAAAAMVLIPSFAMAQETPPPRYESWGVCPFECCMYREWTVAETVPVHASRSDASPVLFHLRKGERVKALTGVVVTVKPAVVTIDRPVRDGYLKDNREPQLDFKAGDKVYLLAPLGEGFYLFWYQGKVYRSGIDLAAMPGVDGAGSDMAWWKKVKNRAGRVGWTRSDAFGNVDACG